MNVTQDLTGRRVILGSAHSFFLFLFIYRDINRRQKQEVQTQSLLPSFLFLSNRSRMVIIQDKLACGKKKKIQRPRTPPEKSEASEQAVSLSVLQIWSYRLYINTVFIQDITAHLQHQELSFTDSFSHTEVSIMSSFSRTGLTLISLVEHFHVRVFQTAAARNVKSVNPTFY